jgi:putative transposase
VKYVFIHDQRLNHDITTLCRVLEVSRSGYYKWRNRRASERERFQERLLKRIQEIFEDSRQTYGCPRIYRQLRREGFDCNHKVVERIMRDNGIQARRKRRFVRTTDSKHGFPVAPNVLSREFTVDQPNEVWVTDITYVATNQGWLYLAVFIDLYSRMVVGWSMDQSMTTDLVLNAFRMGMQHQGCAPLVVHSDRGSQYASDLFRAELDQLDCIQSMSRKGNCWDNAVAESFFGTLKNENVHRTVFVTWRQAQDALFDYIEIFYNKKRAHSAIGYLTPEEKDRHAKMVA